MFDPQDGWFIVESGTSSKNGWFMGAQRISGAFSMSFLRIGPSHRASLSDLWKSLAVEFGGSFGKVRWRCSGRVVRIFSMLLFWKVDQLGMLLFFCGCFCRGGKGRSAEGRSGSPTDLGEVLHRCQWPNSGRRLLLNGGYLMVRTSVFGPCIMLRSDSESLF